VAFWDDFLDNIKSLPGKAIGALGDYASTVVGAGANIGVAQATKTMDINEVAREQIAKNIAFDVKKDIVSTDPLLKAAVAITDNVISPYIARPVSTLGLLTDVESPLYQEGEYQKGFQLSDIRRAYNRSEDVSPMQALTKSDLIPFAGAWSNTILKTGNIDTEQVNLWNDEDIQKNYVENAVGRWYTGIGDFVVGNYAIAGAIKGAAGTLRAGARVSGFSTKQKTAEQFERDINEGLLYKESNGAQGRATASAEDIDAIARSTDINFILPRAQQYSTNDLLPDLLLKTSEPAVVRDLLLADKGYLPALDRLSKSAPDYLWEISDMNAYMSSLYAQTGKVFTPDEVSLQRINAAFDEAIKRNPIHEKIKNAFLTPEGEIKLAGNERYFPAEPVVGAQQFGRAATRAREVAAAARVRDFSKVGGFTQVVLGGGLKAPTTILLRTFGTRKPMGMVTYSGARPLDGVAELDAYFDDFAIFRDGTKRINTSPTESVSAADYRTMWKTRFAEANTSVERNAVIEEFNNVFGEHVARTYGYTNMTKVREFIQELKSEMYGFHSAIAKNGYAMDQSGRRIITDAQTQRQFAESARLLPWNLVEKELVKSSKKTGKRVAIATKENINALFEIGNKWWTFDVLGRPSYIPKNSLFEPILSGTMAQGVSFVTDNAYNAVRSFTANTSNRVMGAASKIYRGKELATVNKAVDDLMAKLNNAYALLDDVHVQYSKFLTDEMSPSAKRQNGAAIQQDLNRTQKLVEEIEIEVGDALRPLGFDVPDVPSIVNLDARIAFLEKNLPAAQKAKLGSAIANAKSASSQAKGSIYSLSSSIDEITAINKNIENVYKEINDIIKDLGESRLQQAKVLGKSARYKERVYGNQKDSARFINGEYVSVSGLFDKNQFGTAYRQELSNARTTEINFLGELKVGSKQALLTRKAPRTITDINEPQYFEELAWVANRTIRGEVFMDQILAGVPEQELIQWVLKNRAYAKSFGVESVEQIPTFVRDKIALVNRYFPDANARQLILNKEVTSVELQEILATKMDRLMPIHPNDFDYLNASAPRGAQGVAWFDDQFSRAAGWVWKKLTAPENPIRWAYADNYFRETVFRKAEVLAKQDIKLTPERINALRQAAARETIKETERVFYTIRRQNRFLFAARVAVAFPTSSMNALYRYSRLAVKNPQRIGGFLYSYHGLFSNFGVDKYGNPVDDPTKATHIVVPGTKELGLKGGRGIELGARGIGFLLNYPSPAVWSAIPVGRIQKSMPNVEEQMIAILGQERYDMLFPYGPQTSLKAALTPVWMRDLVTGLSSDKNDKRWRDTYMSVWDVRMAQFEMGMGPEPTLESVEKEARSLFLEKARWGFGSFFGVPAKVNLKPFSLIEDYYNILVNKHKRGFTDANGVVHKPLNDEDAANAAEKELLAHIPKMPVDRIRFKGSNRVANLYPQQDVYQRIWQDFPDLASDLAKLDPETVSLMTADLERDPEKFSTSIYNFLNDPKTELPKIGIKLNKELLSPEAIEQTLQNNRTWEKYVAFRDALDAEARKRDKTSYRQIPEFEEALAAYADGELKKENQIWWEKKESGAGAEDAAFVQAQSLYKIIKNDKFISKYGDHPFWQDVQDFLSKRQTFAFVYMNMPANDPRKSMLRKAYLLETDNALGTYHPRLQQIIKRYFDDDNLKVVG
jgi:hypothetical protein